MVCIPKKFFRNFFDVPFRNYCSPNHLVLRSERMDESAKNQIQDTSSEFAQIWANLNSRQRIYVESRAAGMRKVESARVAGYSHPNVDCSRLEKLPAVKRAIQLAVMPAVRDAELSRKDVLEGFMDAVRAAGTSAELTQAWREIGRVIGAYEPDKVEVNVKIEDLTQQKLQSMSTSELIELTKQGDVYTVPAENDPLNTEYEALSAALQDPEPIEHG